MKCKKIFALLLSLCMIASSFVAMPVSAADNMSVTVGTVEANPGDTIEVPVTLANNTAGLCGLTLDFTYDPDALTYVNAVQGEALSPGMALTKPGAAAAEGTKRFLWDSMDSDYENGEILILTFEVTKSAVGDYDIDVVVKAACDADFNDIVTDAISGTVTVKEPDPMSVTVGDVEATTGDTIVVPVTLANNTAGLCGLTLDFTYDPDVFKYVNAVAGSALTETMALTKPGAAAAEGAKRFLWDAMDPDYSNGDILLITFEVAKNAVGGEYDIDVEVSAACDSDFNDINTVAIDGTVTVKEPEPMAITVGDVNAKAGEQVIVPVTLANNTAGLCGLTLDFTYDPKVLNYVDAVQGEALKPTMALTKPGAAAAEGTKRFLWDSMDSDYENGEILLITFNVVDGVCSDDYAVDVKVAAACDADFNDIKTVAVGGTVTVDGNPHDYKEEVIKDATCSDKGIKKLTCSVCGNVTEEEIPVNPDNHTYGKWEKDDADNHKKVCSCGDVVTEAHDWDNGVVTKDPTCTDDGVKTFTCSVCGETYTETIKAQGHTYGDWEYADENNHKKVCDCGDEVLEGHAWDAGVVTKDPSHTKEGIKTYTCATCKGTKTESIPPVADSHSYEETVTKAPTCTETGIMTHTCECGKSYTTEIPANGHAWDAGTITLAPTHTTTGIKTYKCTVCGDESKTEIIPANVDDHTYESEITTPATHITEGVKTFTCICGDSYTESIPMITDHEYDKGVVTKEASHFADGVMTFTCICGDSYTEVIPMIPHEYSDWQSIDRTNHKKVCSCSSEVVEPHEWDAGVVTKEPTIAEEGIKTFTCPVCKATYTETIERLPDPDKTTTVKVGAVEAQPGEEVVVPVSISKNLGIVGLEFSIKYDSEVLTLVKYESAEALADLEFTKPGDIKANPIGFLWDGVEPVDNNGEILLLTFKVADNADDKDYAITALDVTACDFNVNDIAVAVIAGKVTVHTHSMSFKSEVAATCTTAGVKAHYICSVCNRAYADEAGDILLETTEVPALGHTYGEWEKENDDVHAKTCTCGHTVREAHAWDAGVITKAATCTEDGVKTYTCATCKGTKTEVIQRLGHAMTFKPEVPATCTEAGVKEHHVCTICGAAYVLGQTTPVDPEDLVIPALGHDLSDWAAEDGVSHKRTCAHCSYYEVAPHTWDAGVITKAATCTETGIKTYTCPTCKVTKTEVIPANGHAMTFVAEVAATCDTAGTKAHYACADCGKTFQDAEGKIELTDLVINAYGHKLNAGEVTKVATCTEKGVMTYTCQVCGIYKEEVEIPAKGHAMTAVAEVAATCTTAGTKAHYVCSVCDKIYEDAAGTKELTDADLVIEQLKHDWEEVGYKPTETKAPTCTTEGIYTYSCSKCGGSYTTIIPANGHDTTFVAEVAATCTTDGTKAHYLCSACGKTFEDADGKIALEDVVITSTGHSYEEKVTKDATCTEAGVKTFTCACGDTYTEAIPAKGHTTSFKTKVAATCTTDGTKAHYLCSVCKKAFEDKAGTIEITDLAIKATGHTWNAGVITTAATCTEDGVKTFTCTVCGEKKTEAIAATGHSMTFNAEVPAECEVDGTKAYYACANCGKTFADKDGVTELTDLVIKAPGHTWDAGVITTAATCTEDGVKTYTCTVCGETKTEVVAATGHTMTTVAGVAATCDTSGIKAHYLCSVCGKTFEDNAGAVEITDVVIPALGHSYGEWEKDDADNHKKVCSVCGDVVTEAHTWDAGVITTEAVCTTDGVKTYTCTVCGETKTETIAAPGHELGDYVAIDGNNHNKECANCDYATAPEAHTWDAGVVTQQPTYGKDGVKTYTCTACGETKTEAIAQKPATATDTIITVADKDVRNGHSIKVPVTISNNIGLADLEFVFEYDTSVLTYTGAEQGDALKSLSLTKPTDLTASTLTFVWEGAENDYTNGDILYLNFTVSDTAALGDYETLAYVSNSVRHDGNETPVYINNGTISVIEYTLGDVNDDGERNVRDVVLLRRFIVGGYGTVILEDAADVTRNGAIATNDLVHLRRFLLGGYPDSDILFN